MALGNTFPVPSCMEDLTTSSGGDLGGVCEVLEQWPWGVFFFFFAGMSGLYCYRMRRREMDKEKSRNSDERESEEDNNDNGQNNNNNNNNNNTNNKTITITITIEAPRRISRATQSWQTILLISFNRDTQIHFNL